MPWDAEPNEPSTAKPPLTLYDGLDVIAEIGTNPATYLRTDNIDEAIARYTTQGERYLITDLLGSTLALTDKAATPQTTYRYSPFGETETTGETSTNPAQYTGREHDGTGLYYYRARYYAPELARFISSDPIGLADGLNIYAYVGNNPVNFIDDSGYKRRSDRSGDLSTWYGPGWPSVWQQQANQIARNRWEQRERERERRERERQPRPEPPRQYDPRDDAWNNAPDLRDFWDQLDPNKSITCTCYPTSGGPPVGFCPIGPSNPLVASGLDCICR